MRVASRGQAPAALASGWAPSSNSGGGSSGLRLRAHGACRRCRQAGRCGLGLWWVGGAGSAETAAAVAAGGCRRLQLCLGNAVGAAGCGGAHSVGEAAEHKVVAAMSRFADTVKQGHRKEKVRPGRRAKVTLRVSP